MRRVVVIAVAAALGLATAAGARPPAEKSRAGPADPEANIVEELVVVARHPAPAWWRVQAPQAQVAGARGGAPGSAVWILGMPDVALPPDVAWRREELDARLAGASGLIVGPRLHAGLEDIFGLIGLWTHLRTDDMEKGLDPALRARFVSARERLGKGPEPYAHWRPLVAGQVLLRDARPPHAVEVGRQVRAEAGRLGVAARPAGAYDLIPFARTALSSLTPQTEAQCLADALDDAEVGQDVYRAAAAGWARGDVAAALKAPRRFDRCLLLLAGGPQLWRSSNDDLAAAIQRSLETPGHAVATVSLRRLLARDGLIDTLKARGLKVVGPNDPDE